MLEMNAIETEIAGIFKDQLGLVVPEADTDLFQSGVLDSLSFVNLLVELEKRFKIAVALEDLELEKFQSIRGIAAFIALNRKAGGRTNHEPPSLMSVAVPLKEHLGGK